MTGKRGSKEEKEEEGSSSAVRNQHAQICSGCTALTAPTRVEEAWGDGGWWGGASSEGFFFFF